MELLQGSPAACVTQKLRLNGPKGPFGSTTVIHGKLNTEVGWHLTSFCLSQCYTLRLCLAEPLLPPAPAEETYASAKNQLTNCTISLFFIMFEVSVTTQVLFQTNRIRYL